MGADHGHGHEHGHDHHHGDDPGEVADYANLAIPDRELRPGALSRRRILQGLGALGVAAAGATGSLASPAAASQAPARTDDSRRFGWFAGDHHIHTTFSRDAMYDVDDQVSNAQRYGLDWMVITDHGNAAHQKLSIDQITPKIAAARRKFRPLVFQGLEWNVPGAEHATFFVPPTEHAVDVLRGFELFWDGDIIARNQNPTGPGVIVDSVENTPAAELQGILGLNWIKGQLLSGAVPAALVLANHPMRKGQVSPHELRQWRDTAPEVAVGWEGAPGHQGAGIAAPRGGGGARGEYGNAPGPNSFAGYGPEFYRTWGGFDYATAQVGGLWDSLLAEGRPWWITANSDNHLTYLDTREVGNTSAAFYLENGNRGVRTDGHPPHPEYPDFWPGFYSRTYVGADRRDYLSIMDAIRNGRMFLVHGGLVDAVEVRVRTGAGPGVTFGDRTWVRRGRPVAVDITITLASRPNFNGDLPRLATVDLIKGTVTGPVGGDARDTLSAPGTSVVRSFEVARSARRTVRFSHIIRDTAEPFYLRLRGSDGKHTDSAGNPLIDTVGNDDPWDDLWFYTNPTFVDVR
jgi:hypothetical protein